MAEHLIPEPPDRAVVLFGDPPVQVAVVRDDASTYAARDQRPHDTGSGWDWSQIPDDVRWWLVHEEYAPPFTWAELNGDVDPPNGDYLPVGLNRQAVTRLFTQRELDEAVRAAQLTPVGEHLIEPGGYCRSCGVRHSPEEIARAEDRAEADHV